MTNVVPLKRLARIRYGLGQPPPASENGVPILRATNISRGKIDSVNLIRSNLEDLPLDRAPLLAEGEILVVRSGACTGDSARVSADWAGSAPGYDLRVTPDSAEPRFLAYSLLGDVALGQMALVSTRAAQPHLNAEELGQLEVWAPSYEEQCRIADFLDTETGKIENIVSKKRRLVQLLEERSDSRILSHVGASALVTGSTGASVQPVRRLMAKVLRVPTAGAGTVTAYRDGHVTERSLRRAEGYTLSGSAEAQGQYVVPGDVVIHGLDGFAGAIGVSEAFGNCSPVYHVCEPQGDGDAHFFGRLLRLLALQGYLGNFATSTRERAVDFRNWDLFGRIPLPVVPVEEQREIGAAIRRIRPLKELVERSAALAAERRQALITAAVTGQFDVSTASGRNVTEGITA
ncbi:restriction endonuclease subunit S [Streptomyces sp. NPDC057575]|uniref:restriction endonuclease subunit S n=1 Tax=unclassified Streptomyces TaxID=2593676 RepID=UPI0036AE5AFF